MASVVKANVMNPILVPSSIIDQTLAKLQHVGRRRSECVVLWLGRREDDNIRVEELYVPIQEASYDYFHIPENSMERLFQKIRPQRLMIAAQVHTHPRSAFHSYADDTWAIIRHAGALSLVIPYFAQRTHQKTFVSHTSVFALSSQNVWCKVPKKQITEYYRIIP